MRIDPQSDQPRFKEEHVKLKTALGGVAVLTAVSLALTACGRADDGGSGPSEAVTLDDSPADFKLIFSQRI